jgi:aldose 1-epimerase
MSLLERDVVALCAGELRCDVAPHAGGAVAGFWAERGGRRIDWLRRASAADIARGAVEGMACFPLVPWAGVIRGGRFRFCGREVAQPGCGRDAPHGHGWRRAWEVTGRAADRVQLDYLHEPDDWPWRYHARQTVALADGRLILTVEIVNLSGELMPAGLGFHAAVPRTPDVALAAPARGLWRGGSDQPPRDCADLAAGRPLAAFEPDTVLAGWHGQAAIAWPERAARLCLEADWPLLSFLGLEQPPAAQWFCLAPMSHCPDAINLARAGAADTGLRVLAPGAARRATLTLRPETPTQN